MKYTQSAILAQVNIGTQVFITETEVIRLVKIASHKYLH